jgi:hypothetical protein
VSNNTELPLTQWKLLRLGNRVSSNDETPTLASAIDTGFGLVRYALNTSGEARALIPLSSHQNSLSELSSLSLSVQVSRLQLNGIFATYADITCNSSDLDPIFSEVLIELLDRIQQGQSAIDAIEGTLADFRALLIIRPATEVTIEEITGLIGELLLLDNLLCFDSKAWKAWRGPLSERHDFRAADIAIEVKSTKKIGSKIISISSLDQLKEPTGGSLYLYHVTLEEVINGGLSVSNITDSILKKSSDPEQIMLRLLNIGCNSPHSQAWNRYKFNVNQYGFYRTDGKFPKITRETFSENDLPLGVLKIKYDVDLGYASEYKLAKNEETKLLKDLILCLVK